MKPDKSKTPSKAELLDELESIREFLNDEEEIEAQIPTLTSIAEAPLLTAGDNPTPPTIEPSVNKAPENNGDTDEKLAEQHKANADIHDDESLELELELDLAFDSAPNHQPEARTSENSSSTDTEVLDDMSNTQKSLFDESQPESKGPQTRSFKRKPQSQRDNKQKLMPKARGENPFLPPHIRERLGRHKELFESVPEDIALAMAQRERLEMQGDLLSGFGFHRGDESMSQMESILSASIGSGDLDKEALIDALVAEFLPQIEAKLRAKLRETTLKDDQ